MADHDRGIEIRDGFILRTGRLRPVIERERPAATHLIGAFNIGTSQDGLPTGTVACFRGNMRGEKVPGYVELGPEQLGTRPGGFWAKIKEQSDLLRTMRIDRQKYFDDNGKRFCNYQLQVADESIACVLVRINVSVGPGVMRRAFTLSLDTTKNVMIDPTDPGKGYMHVR